MPKVGNKTFPYTSKGIDDAKKEKKRISSGATVQKRKAAPSPKSDSPYTLPKGKPAPRIPRSKVILPRTAPKKIGQVTKGKETFYAVDKKRKMK